MQGDGLRAPKQLHTHGGGGLRAQIRLRIQGLRVLKAMGKVGVELDQPAWKLLPTMMKTCQPPSQGVLLPMSQGLEELELQLTVELCAGLQGG
jgi:hypothetical protein